MLSLAMWTSPAQPCYITFRGEMVRLKVINEEEPDILEISSFMEKTLKWSFTEVKNIKKHD